MILFIKEVREQKKCVINQILKFNDYKKCLFHKNQNYNCNKYLKLKPIMTKSIRLIRDDKRLQIFDGFKTYLYGTNAFKVCTSEMISKYKWLILMIIQLEITQKFKMKTEQKSRWPDIPDYPYRISIIGDSGSGRQIHYQI